MGLRLRLGHTGCNLGLRVIFWQKLVIRLAKNRLLLNRLQGASTRLGQLSIVGCLLVRGSLLYRVGGRFVVLGGKGCMITGIWTLVWLKVLPTRVWTVWASGTRPLGVVPVTTPTNIVLLSIVLMLVQAGCFSSTLLHNGLLHTLLVMVLTAWWIPLRPLLQVIGTLMVVRIYFRDRPVICRTLLPCMH